MTVRLDAATLQAMRRHAEVEYPNECCGVLFGALIEAGWQVIEACPLPNRHPQPRIGFSIDSMDLYAACRGSAHDLVGAYHSHPGSLARPSATDRDAAPWPDFLCLILGIDGPHVFVSGAWNEVPLIEEDMPCPSP